MRRGVPRARGRSGIVWGGVLARAGWRWGARHPWQVGLAVLGVALGLAVVVAIQLANGSARKAFLLSSETLTGSTTHQVVAGSAGIPERYFTDLVTRPGAPLAAPVVTGWVVVEGDTPRGARLLGVDPLQEAPFRGLVGARGAANGSGMRALLSEPGAVLMERHAAARQGLGIGSEIRLRVGARGSEARIVGLFDAGSALAGAGDLLVADIATAQEVLGRLGRLDRIDLIVPEGDALRRLQEALPPGLRIVRAAARTRALGEMTRAFELNLRMLGMLALLVGAFLIYNTMSFSVVQRRALLGTLRALGVTRAQVLGLVMAEALVLGAVGACLGAAGGVLLADRLLALTTRTINDLYYTIQVRDVAVDPADLGVAVLTGIVMAMMAALGPALEAARVAPRSAMARSHIEARARRWVPRAAGIGALLLLGSLALLLPGRSLVLAFVGLFGLILGASLLAPGAGAVLLGLIRFALRPLGGIVASLTVGGLIQGLSRTGLALAALMVAVSATVGVGVMVDSFRQSVAGWLASTLRADLYVSRTGLTAAGPGAVLEPELVRRLSTVPGVGAVSSGRQVEVESELGPLRLKVFGLVPRSYAGFRLLSGRARDAWPAFHAGQGVLVSESLAFRHRLKVGSPLRLYTERGTREFRVVAIYADYSSEQGVVAMDREVYERLWDDPGVAALGIYLRPGARLDVTLQAMQVLAAGVPGLVIRSNRVLREASMEVFDRTFTVTKVLRLLAGLVAFVGVLSALMAQQLERTRELAVYRASGMTMREVWALVLGQSGLMGLVAGLLAVPLGLAMAVVLVRVINLRSFGWSLQVHVDPDILLQATLLSVLAALLAGVYPAWRMARTSPALALRED